MTKRDKVATPKAAYTNRELSKIMKPLQEALIEEFREVETIISTHQYLDTDPFLWQAGNSNPSSSGPPHLRIIKDV